MSKPGPSRSPVKTANFGRPSPAARSSSHPSTPALSQEVFILSPEGLDPWPIKREVDSLVDLGSADEDNALDLKEAEINRLLKDDIIDRMEADNERDNGMSPLGEDDLRHVEAIQLGKADGVEDGEQPPPKRKATYAAVASATGAAPLRAFGVLIVHSGWDNRQPLSRRFFDSFVSRISLLCMEGDQAGGILNDVLWSTWMDGRGLIAVNSEEALHRIQRWINEHPDNANRSYSAWEGMSSIPGT